ncbi:hypothetical protein [Nostoc sp.]
MSFVISNNRYRLVLSITNYFSLAPIPFPIDGGVEVVRIVSGYRDLETVFLSEDIP